MIGRLLAKLAVNELTADKGDTSLWQRVGGRIYDTERPQTSGLPAIVVSTSTVEREDNFDRTLGTTTYRSADIDGQITVLVMAPLLDQETAGGSDGAQVCGELAEMVRGILHGLTVEEAALRVTFIERQAEIINITDEAVTGEMLFAALGAVCKELPT